MSNLDLMPKDLGPIYELVRIYNPLLLGLTFLILGFLIYLNRDVIKERFSEVSPITWIALLMVVLGGIGLSHSLGEGTTTTGKLWMHADLAQDMKSDYSQYLERPIIRPEAYPFTLFLLFTLVGENIHAIGWLSLLLTAGTAAMIFASVYLITDKEIPSLLSALVFFTLPLTVSEAQKGNALALYGFFASSAFTAMLLSIDVKKIKTITLAGIIFLLSLATRMEAAYLGILAAIGYLAFLKTDEYRKLVLPGLIVIVLLIQLLPFIVVSNNVFGLPERNSAHVDSWREMYPDAIDVSFHPSHLPRNFTHISKVLSRTGTYQFFNPLLLLFLMAGIFSTYSYRKLSLALIWAMLFFLFFGTWALTAAHGMTYHLTQLMIPISMLIGVGAYGLGEKVLEMADQWIQKPLKGYNLSQFRSIITLALGVLVITGAANSYYTDNHAGKETNFYTDVSETLSDLSEDACILVEDQRIGRRVNPERLVQFSTNKEVQTSIKECTEDSLYYLKLKENIPHWNFPEDFYSIFQKLDSDCRMENVSESMHFTLFDVKCNGNL